MSLNLFQVLPATFIQESLATSIIYENLDSLYKLDNEVRLSLLDLIRLNKLKLFNGIVYAFGRNEFGQLGTSSTSNRRIPTPIDFSTIIDKQGRMKKVVQVSAGDTHSLILCADGSVYSFGNGYYGKLGTNSVYSVKVPTQIDISNIGSKRVIQVSAGHLHSLILCEDGTVYSFGNGEYGRLGTGNTDIAKIPTKIDTSNMDGKRVIQVSAGGSHSLILCEDGTIYSFGYNGFGELGTGNRINAIIPTPINTSNIGSKRVVQVSAGSNHSLILCEDGTVYSFGYNRYGQLGNGTTNKVKIPTSINTTNIGSKRVIQVSAVYLNSLILCEDGTVYSSGYNDEGVTGTGNTNNIVIPTPTEIDTSNIGSKRVIQISAGSTHSLLLCEDGSVYSFGWNVDGQLGTGETNNVAIPTQIDTSLMDGQKVIYISAGSVHSLILT